MSDEEIMSEEAFKELIDNLEIIEKLTPYGRKAIKYWVNKLQKENEEKNKIIKLFEHECRKFKAFCRRVRKDGHDIDLFNQGQEHKCNQFLNLINGESHWDYEGKHFDETDKEIKKISKEE